MSDRFRGRFNACRSYHRSPFYRDFPVLTVGQMKELITGSYCEAIRDSYNDITAERRQLLLTTWRIVDLFETVNDGLRNLNVSMARFSNSMGAQPGHAVWSVLEEARLVRNSAAHRHEGRGFNGDLASLHASMEDVAWEFVHVLNDWIHSVRGNHPVHVIADDFLRYWYNNNRIEVGHDVREVR